jgi:hypothetical protein
MEDVKNHPDEIKHKKIGQNTNFWRSGQVNELLLLLHHDLPWVLSHHPMFFSVLQLVEKEG